jgi:hypothetical protein
MIETTASGRLLGYVQVRVGANLVTVPVQAMNLDRDGLKAPGGFYSENGQLGIYVDDTVSPKDVEEQIRRGSNDAVLHISKKVFN